MKAITKSPMALLVAGYALLCSGQRVDAQQGPLLMVNGLQSATVEGGSPVSVILQPPGRSGTCPTYWVIDSAPGPTIVGGVTVPLALGPGFQFILNGVALPCGVAVATNLVAPAVAAAQTWYSVAGFPDPSAPSGIQLTSGASLTVVPSGGGVPLPSLLEMVATPYLGRVKANGQESLAPIPALPAGGVPSSPGASPSVPRAQVVTGAAGDQDFLQATFTAPILASTLATGSAVTGVSVWRRVGGTLILEPFSLDSAGAIFSGNAFNGPAAPAVLRIYYDTDNNLFTPERLPAGEYLVTIAPGLMAINGAQFCTACGRSCASGPGPRLSFAVGTDTVPLGMSGGGVPPSSPASGDPSVPVSTEIELNFSEAVAFETLVDATNLSALDPFITMPIPLLLLSPACSPTVTYGADVGNLYVDYTPPAGVAAANLAVVAYMPFPVSNPTLVRIRFVGAAGLIGAPGSSQNYGSGCLPIAAPVAGGMLGLPSGVPVPGSAPSYIPGFAAGAAVTRIVVTSSNPGSAFATCTSPAPPGGVRDRAGNALLADFVLQFTWAAGAARARNPQSPDAVFVSRQTGSSRGIAALNTAAITTSVTPTANTQAPPWAGATLTGSVSLAANPLTQSWAPVDMELGHWLRSEVDPTQTSNNIANPGRGATAVAGVPDTQLGGFTVGLQNVVGYSPSPTPPLQPFGQYLYVIDGSADTVRVLNSYDFQPIGVLPGPIQPRGLGISPDLEFLYVSDFIGNVVYRFHANPTSPNFHALAGVIPLTGSGPTAVSVQPDNEDVLVANFGDNSFSIIDVTSQTERARFADAAAIGPSDIVVTPRMVGGTDAYLAFVLNRFSDNVTVYESDIPSGVNGSQGAIVTTIGGFAGPARGVWNRQSLMTAAGGPGCLLANTQGLSVDELVLQSFTLTPTNTRTFGVVRSLASPLMVAPADVTIDAHSGLYDFLALGLISNDKSLADPAAGMGSRGAVIVSYPAADLIATFDPATTMLLSTTSVPGCDFLHSFYDQ